MVKITTQNIEFSIFSIALQSFLESSHPNLTVDTKLILQRGDTAAEVFEQARRTGSTIDQALELANHVLYLGLKFSLYDTIKNILWEEFEGVVPEYAFDDKALELCKQLSYITNRYNLTDDFEESDEYETLYTELTGAILISFNDYGI